MTPASAKKAALEPKGRRWVWQLDLAQYDRRGALSEGEGEAIRAVLRGPGRQQFTCEPWQTRLRRLLEPISDALNITGAKDKTVRGTAVGILLRGMLRHNCSIWKWGEHHWDAVLGKSVEIYRRLQGVQANSRPHLIGLGILLQRVRDPRRFGEFDRTSLAKKVFGAAVVEDAVKRVAETLIKWGFSGTLNDTRQRTALCDALLVNGSPFLEDLTAESLEEACSGHTTAERKRSLQRLSNALSALGLIRMPLRHGFMKARGGKRNGIAAGISTRWVQAAERWRATSPLSPRTRAEMFYLVLKIGRWITKAHPAEASPELWTRETAARCVAEIRRMSVGQWSNQVRVQFNAKRRLLPRAVNGYLQAIRYFFREAKNGDGCRESSTPTVVCVRPPALNA